jgi:hypothetical protein
MIPGMAELVGAVQTNCDIADARHARDVSLCTYLLGMREFFRWEHQLPYGVAPPRDDVGRWIAEREARWEALADDDYVPLPVAGRTLDPFAVAEVNAALAGSGLVYGAGIGRFRKPHFFLAELTREEQRGEAQLLVCGCEYARDVAAIPAASQGNTLIVRREALRQWLWEKAEGWSLKQQDGALREALAAHGYEADPAMAIERMVEAETEALAWHEEGEWQAARRLGPAWGERMAGLSSRRAELLLRATRDNLADCLVTLPRLAAVGSEAMRQFWLASFDGLRRELFPAIAKVGAGDTARWAELATRGAGHFESLARRLLAEPEQEIERLSHRAEELGVAAEFV